MKYHGQSKRVKMRVQGAGCEVGEKLKDFPSQLVGGKKNMGCGASYSGGSRQVSVAKEKWEIEASA